jgi:cytochrome c biogenesis protein CcmG/thiol:disulfide interchange protein DsbE
MLKDIVDSRLGHEASDRGVQASAVEASGPLPARVRRSRITTLVVMGVTGAIILTVAILVNQSAVTADGTTAVTLTGASTGAPPTVGKPAPDFQAATVDGRVVRLSDFLGRPVWLTFGASWCQPCRSENVDIQATYETWKDEGVVVLAIFISEEPTSVADYASRVGLTYLQVADPETRIASAYRILGIPSHYFIDRLGVLRQVRIGTLDPAGMVAALTEIQH